jgi:O-antigen/teichoic acid export membrane protein
MYLRKKMVPELHFHRALVSWKKVKTMVSHGVWNSINSLGTVLNSGLDLLISNLMLSSLATGQISIAKTIEMMFVAVQQLVTQPFQPTLLKAYAGGDGEEFFRELSKAMKLTGLLSNIFLGGFIALGQLYYRLWLPGQDDQMLYRLTVLTILTSLLSGVMRPVYYVYTVTVKNRIPCLVTVAGGFFNVAGMYLLLRFTNLGAYAVVLTTVVVMFSINLIFNPLYASHCIHIRPFRMYCVILRHIVSAVLMTVVFCLLKRWLQPSGWIGLAASAALMAVLGAGIHVLVCMTPKKGKTNR